MGGLVVSVDSVVEMKSSTLIPRTSKQARSIDIAKVTAGLGSQVVKSCW